MSIPNSQSIPPPPSPLIIYVFIAFYLYLSPPPWLRAGSSAPESRNLNPFCSLIQGLAHNRYWIVGEWTERGLGVQEWVKQTQFSAFCKLTQLPHSLHPCTELRFTGFNLAMMDLTHGPELSAVFCRCPRRSVASPFQRSLSALAAKPTSSRSLQILIWHLFLGK